MSVTLAHLGRDLRCGGRLVIRLSQDTPPERIRRMRLCLMSHGFLPTAAAEDWPGGDRLLCARKANKPRACAA